MCSWLRLVGALCIHTTSSKNCRSLLPRSTVIPWRVYYLYTLAGQIQDHRPRFFFHALAPSPLARFSALFSRPFSPGGPAQIIRHQLQWNQIVEAQAAVPPAFVIHIVHLKSPVFRMTAIVGLQDASTSGFRTTCCQPKPTQFSIHVPGQRFFFVVGLFWHPRQSFIYRWTQRPADLLTKRVAQRDKDRTSLVVTLRQLSHDSPDRLPQRCNGRLYLLRLPHIRLPRFLFRFQPLLEFTSVLAKAQSDIESGDWQRLA